MALAVSVRPGLVGDEEPNDLAAMHALDQSCFAQPFRFRYANLLRFARTPDAVVRVAESVAIEEGLAGFVIVQLYRRTRSAYVVTLDVDPRVRRLGVAAALMHATETEAMAAGARRIDLHVHTGNDAAIRFYERHGYVQESLQKDLYGEGLDGWVYRKPLIAA